MDRLVEGISLVEEVNGLIQSLQESLDLFERGKDEVALEKIDSVEEGIEDLKIGELPGREEIEEMLSDARTNLEWVSENADRVKGHESDSSED
jgi:hypothetical protein